MSDREQLAAIKHLIQTKQYRKARKALKRVDHPTARKWEGQLDTIAPESKRPSVWAILGYLVVSLVGCALVAVILWATPPAQAARANTALSVHCGLSNMSSDDQAAACEAQIATVPQADLLACWRTEGSTDVFDAGHGLARCLNARTGSSF